MFKTQIIPRCLPILKCYGDTHLLIGTTGSTFEVGIKCFFFHVSHSAEASRLSLPSWGIVSLTSHLGHHTSHFSAGASRLSLLSWESRLSLPSWGITSLTSQLGHNVSHFSALQCGHHSSHFTMGHHTTHPGASRLSPHRTGIAPPTSQ